MFDTIHFGGSFSAQCRENIRKTSADIRNIEARPVQRRWTTHNTAMQELPLAETTWHLTQTFGVQSNMRAHVLQSLRITKTIFVDRFMYHRHTIDLRQ